MTKTAKARAVPSSEVVTMKRKIVAAKKRLACEAQHRRILDGEYRMASTTIGSMALGGSLGSLASPVGTVIGAAAGVILGYGIASWSEKRHNDEG